MRPNLHPFLVNGRFGDPALFVEMLHQRGALLFDLGDLSPLSNRDLLRVAHVFVSHMHMDHFIGFDALLRVNVGREKIIRMFGPEGFCERVHHKLQAYEWDLSDRYSADLVFDVTEVRGHGTTANAIFRFKNRFGWDAGSTGTAPDGLLLSDATFTVKTALLEHHGPCLGFAIEEKAHINVWKNRLEERGLPTGQWLQVLKRSIVEGCSDDLIIHLPAGATARLGGLRDLVSVSAGQKIAYVTDVADTPANRAAIVKLADGADTIFIEARFAAADAEQARDRAHLTTDAAGGIARAANARTVEPFHFSPRYEGEEERMVSEVTRAFARL